LRSSSWRLSKAKRSKIVAYGTFNAWKIGKKGQGQWGPSRHCSRRSSGADRDWQGHGGELTDLQTQDIIQNQIGPALKQDHFYQAIRAGTDAIAAAINGRPQPGSDPNSGHANAGYWNPL